MRIAGEAAAFGEFLAEGLKVADIEAAFEEGARVVAGGGVALEVNHVAVTIGGFSAEEMVLGDFVEGGRGGKGRDVAAETIVVAVGGDDHGHGVPADVAADAAFDAGVAGVLGLVLGWDGVCVRR